MVERRQGDPSNPLKPLPKYTIAGAVAAIALVILGITLWTDRLAGPDPRARFEALRLGLTSGIGVGAIIALAVSIRRQRASELETSLNAYDADEKRITELFASAAEQLGNENAAVRLAGLYSLDRLGESVERQRQIVMDLICAYLRMPRPIEPGDPETYDPRHRSIVEQFAQEREVRLTAQRLIRKRIERSTAEEIANETEGRHWRAMNVDLTGATLENFEADHASVDRLSLAGAKLLGSTSLRELRATADFDISGAHSQRDVDITSADFSCHVDIRDFSIDGALYASCSQFHRGLWIVNANIGPGAVFADAQFDGLMVAHVTFWGSADFSKTKFWAGALFQNCAFHATFTLYEAEFTRTPRFDELEFEEQEPYLEGATVSDLDVSDAGSELLAGWVIGGTVTRSNSRRRVITRPER